jgi:hypothetical protein
MGFPSGDEHDPTEGAANTSALGEILGGPLYAGPRLVVPVPFR